MTYQEWITAHIAQHGALLFGRCAKSTDEMREVFPELTIVRGHVFDGCWGQRAHIWLTAPDGSIVDPTASQYPCLGEYEPWVPGTEVEVGVCYECGESIYRVFQSLDENCGSEMFCSDRCERIVLAELNSSISNYGRF